MITGCRCGDGALVVVAAATPFTMEDEEEDEEVGDFLMKWESLLAFRGDGHMFWDSFFACNVVLLNGVGLMVTTFLGQLMEP